MPGRGQLTELTKIVKREKGKIAYCIKLNCWFTQYFYLIADLISSMHVIGRFAIPNGELRVIDGFVTTVSLPPASPHGASIGVRLLARLRLSFACGYASNILGKGDLACAIVALPGRL